MSPVEDNFEAIERAALESYLLDLARGLAAEEERVRRENRGEDHNILIRDVQIAGEYPDRHFKIRKYNRKQDKESTRTYAIYRNPGFFDGAGKRLCDPERIVGDTLMLARGG